MKSFDPHQDPSSEELEASGAKNWFKDSIAQQEKVNAELKSSLRGDTHSLKSQKKELQNLLELPPDLNPEEPAPDLFAAERAKAKKESSSLPSLLNDLENSRSADRDALKNLFGK